MSGHGQCKQSETRSGIQTGLLNLRKLKHKTSCIGVWVFEEAGGKKIPGPCETAIAAFHEV